MCERERDTKRRGNQRSLCTTSGCPVARKIVGDSPSAAHLRIRGAEDSPASLKVVSCRTRPDPARVP